LAGFVPRAVGVVTTKCRASLTEHLFMGFRKARDLGFSWCVGVESQNFHPP
jgi:hypothetical protein